MKVILGTKIRIKDPTGIEDKRQLIGSGNEPGTSLPAQVGQPGAGVVPVHILVEVMLAVGMVLDQPKSLV